MCVEKERLFTNRLSGAVRFVRFHFVKKAGKTRVLTKVNPALKNMNMQRVCMYSVVTMPYDSHSLKTSKLIYTQRGGYQGSEKYKDIKRFVAQWQGVKNPIVPVSCLT